MTSSSSVDSAVDVNPYDRVSYTSFARPQTYPGRLAALARMHGLEPARLESCRVLELGCGDGVNLLPLACAFPGSEFVGLDYAAAPLEVAGRDAAELGLKNVRLVQADVSAPPDDLGTFDYIVAHGLFSWVPPEAQEGTLELYRRLLRPQGVGYISYNVYPGWATQMATRRMMQYHTRQGGTAEEKAERGRAMIELLSEHGVTTVESYRMVLKEEVERLKSHVAGYLFHDDMNEWNTPFYFHEFAERLEGHGLQFLCESEAFAKTEQHFSPEAGRWLGEMAEGGRLVREQYLDFLVNRKFRQSLVCHAGLEVEGPVAERIGPEFRVSSSLRMTGELGDGEALRNRESVEFRGTNGTKATTDIPLLKAALHALGRVYPQALTFRELQGWATVLAGLEAGMDDAEVRRELQFYVMSGFSVNLLLLQLYTPVLVTEAGERPEVFAYARMEAVRGTRHLTTLKHSTVEIRDGFLLPLIALMDGTRSRGELAEAFGRLPEEARGAMPDLTDDDMDKILNFLGENALLVG